MIEKIKNLLDSQDYSIVESFKIDSKPAQLSSIPSTLYRTKVGKLIENQTAPSSKLWLHQAKSIEKLLDDRNIVISTGTASGKSLIFQSVAFHKTILDQNCKVLVFYPLKALISDQFRSWNQMAKDLDLPGDYIGKIHGSIPMNDRERILTTSRIILMTPDVCHAWFMSRLSKPENKSFLRQLSLIVLDEAHTLEGVFGSNFSFLMRRMLHARNELVNDKTSLQSVQIIGATATISNPKEHMKELTNFVYDLIDADDDGAPHENILCVHIATPSGEETKVAKMLQSDFLRNVKQGGFVTFIDSRKGVEVLAHASQVDVQDVSGDKGVLPYRAGYRSDDRASIEKQLQDGTLRGVVTTSALELGIHLPHLVLGLNIGVPSTRKSYRQRLGRIGRNSEGVFIVLSPSNAFKAFGTTFQEYHDMSVEPSYLYLENRFMQFAHARCLIDELGSLGGKMTLSAPSKWPSGFDQVYNAAKPGGNRPPEFDMIAQLGSDTPQLSYPLRNIGEINFKISLGENTEALGEVNESQALRECYPGAVYFHLASAYKVQSWNTRAFTPFIKVKRTSPKYQTKPIIKTWINASIAPMDILSQHFIHGEDGFMVECNMQITERVEGYKELPANKDCLYADMRQIDSNYRPRSRNFRSSGVLLSFGNEKFNKYKVKSSFVDVLADIFQREYSVLPQDIGTSSTNISVRNIDGIGGLKGNAIVVFDQTYGSLRLTENLFLNFLHLLERLSIAVNLDKDNKDNDLIDVINLLSMSFKNWKSNASVDIKADSLVGDTKYMEVFSPDSLVCLREKGVLTTDVRIIQPTIMNGKLMYQVCCDSNSKSAKRWVAASIVEPSAVLDDWEYKWWNAETQSFEEPEEPEEPRENVSHEQSEV